LNDLYGERCSCCGDELPDLADNEDWDKIYTDIATQLLNGDDLNTDAIYNRTAKQLISAMNKGLGGTSFDDNDSRIALQKAFTTNLEAFSYAKTLTQFKLFKDAMFNDKRQIQSFAAVKKIVADTGEVFNNNYLRAEHQFVTASAIMAHKWETLDSEYLEFTTVGDNRVRPEHKLFDKFTALKTDPIWKRLYTPLDWGCRCTVIPGIAKNVSKEYDSDWANKVVDPLVKGTIFDNNVALSKVIFNDKHPYFKEKEKKEVSPADELKILRKAKDVEIKEWASKRIKKGQHLTITGEQFKTAEVRISKSNIESLLKHISNVNDKDAVKDIEDIIKQSNYSGSKKLENKDPKNYGSKVARGVESYNYYQSKWKGIEVEINMEVMKNGYEQPYAILFNKK
jgi:hypothetical protein